MPRFLLPLIVLVCLTPRAFAQTQLTITGVSGASNYISNGSPTIFGGFAGPACTNTDGYTPCNNCIASSMTTCSTAPLCSCNEGRAYDGLVVRVALATSGTAASGQTTTTGEAYAYVTSVNNGTTSTTPNTSLPKVTSTNNGAFVDFTWGNICSMMGPGSCETLVNSAGTSSAGLINSPSASITIYQDTTGSAGGAPGSGAPQVQVTVRVAAPPSGYEVYGNTQPVGIGAFSPYPGDGQIYIRDLQSASGFPTLNYGVSAQALRIFPAKTSLNEANYQTLPVTPSTLPLTGTGDTLTSNVVSGLDNNQLYFFRLAVVDQANNVLQYFPGDATSVPASCTSAPSSDCQYAATPAQTLGVLTKDLNCFIATAAYGSALEPKLDTFREFRQRFLLGHAWGLKFVHWYYDHGTQAARFIADKPLLRAVVRGALWPAYGFSAYALEHGLPRAIGLLIVILFTLSVGAIVVARKAWTRV